MSGAENAALVRRYFNDCVSAVTGLDRDLALALLDELITADFTMAYSHESSAEAARGRDRHKEFLVGHAEAFPDDQWTVEVLVADDEVVACEWRFRGTHAESGNRVDLLAADFFTFRDGRLATLHRFLDFADFRAQLKRRSTRE
jgi:ketosteroid isomerase-like protein